MWIYQHSKDSVVIRLPTIQLITVKTEIIVLLIISNFTADSLESDYSFCNIKFNSIVLMQKHDVSNDVSKINKHDCEAPTMDVKSVGNGQPEENSSPVVNKSVTDTSEEKSHLDINTAKSEEPKREKPDTNGSSSPVKRKQVRDKSESESEERGSPTKKPRSDAAEHSSQHADDSTRMSDEDGDSSAKTSPKKQKRHTPKVATHHYVHEDDLERTFMWFNVCILSSYLCHPYVDSEST